MPCSCGNTTCPCGIPCYCSEESCKCHTCSLALHRFCKICNKPLITDMQTDKDTCSCFVGESTALILENRDNPQCLMGNTPMPVGCFVYGKLMVNMMIPVLHFPQRPVCLMPPKPSIQANSRNILPSFISDEDEATLFRPGEDSSIPSTAELHQLLDESNDLAQADNVTTLQMNEKPLDPTRITEQSNLEIHGERVEFEASLAIGTGNKFDFPVSENFNATTLIEPSNEILENYLMHDKKLAAVSTAISFSGVQEPSGVLSQPVSAVSTSAFRMNDCLQVCPASCSVAKAISTSEEWQNINFCNSHQIPSTTQSIPEYFAAPNTTSKLQPLFNKRSAQSSEENEYPQSGNPSSVLENKRKEEIDSIPLYIDTFTTQKMEKLLKPSKH